MRCWQICWLKSEFMNNLFKDGVKLAFISNLYWIAPLVIGLMVLIYIVAGVRSCQDSNWMKKTTEQKNEIQQGKGAAQEIEQQREDKKDEIKQVDSAANNSAGNFNAVQQTDSSTRSNNYNATRAEWCKDHPADSKCK